MNWTFLERYNQYFLLSYTIKTNEMHTFQIYVLIF
jgi:hypothetical protein